jgi:hypothetical protein
LQVNGGGKDMKSEGESFIDQIVGEAEEEEQKLNL